MTDLIKANNSSYKFALLKPGGIPLPAPGLPAEPVRQRDAAWRSRTDREGRAPQQHPSTTSTCKMQMINNEEANQAVE